MQHYLLLLSWLGMILSVVGTHFQSKLNMKTAFKWFIVADFLLIGIQIYLGVWSQALLFLVYFYMSTKGLINCYEKPTPVSSRYSYPPDSYPTCAIGPHQGACESAFCFPKSQVG